MKFAASILLFAFLMAIRDEFENSYARMLVAAAAGASLALMLVNTKSSRERTEQVAPQRRARGLLWIATVMYVVSWFLPVIKDGWTLDEGLPGWQAVRVALTPLVEPRQFSKDPWFSFLSAASGLTNVFMLAALVRLHRDRTPSANLWLWVAWATAAINASWISWEGQSLRVGYFCWFLSFVFLAVSLVARSHRVQVREPQLSTP